MLQETQYYLKIKAKDLQKSDIDKLAKILEYHADLYYNHEAPIISDIEYDTLLKLLESLEERYGITQKYSEKVGDDIKESSFEKVAHSRPMISLWNTYNSEDLHDFDTRVKKHLDEDISDIEYCLEYKFDWLGIELIYKNWVFTQAITRGNWLEWEDVTENIRTISNIPKSISYTEYLEVRGEVVMPISEFNKLNQKGKEDGMKIFSNPRNAASGSVRMKDNTITAQRNLKFFAYDIGNFDAYVENTRPHSYTGVIYNLEKIGFEISSYFESFKNIHTLSQKIENFWDYKSKIDFEVDGLVVKVKDIWLWKQIWFTEHHPKYAIAYKFPAEIFTTSILSVDHQVGRTGTITPAANLETVNIGGANIRRATLHNYEEVQKLDVRIGDRIFIKRAGEVIPKVIAVADPDNSQREDYEKISVPPNCPYCDTAIVKDGEKVRYYCPNRISCPKQISEQLIYAVGKSGFNIDGLWVRQIEIFLEEWIIYDLPSIFLLSEKTEAILELEGFKEKSVENLLKGIEKVKKTKIDIVLRSLGIEGVGKKTAKNLSVLFQSESDLLKFDHTLETIEQIPDIGPEVAKNLQEYFSDPKNISLCQKLSELLEIEYYVLPVQSSSSIFSGKTVCITGSFEHNWEKVSRDTLVEQLESLWGKFTSSVSKKTDFLLAGEKSWSKLQKAQDLWVQILNLEQFYWQM